MERRSAGDLLLACEQIYKIKSYFFNTLTKNPKEYEMALINTKGLAIRNIKKQCACKDLIPDKKSLANGRRGIKSGYLTRNPPGSLEL
jgi:hypothetical protein